jgi:tartrate/fumarate subfamily iron-sulfur-dependent hydro-lyase alpha chain
LQELCDEGVRRGYLNPDNPLRASVLDDPIFARKNTKDNTPCIVNVELVQGDIVDVQLASKGGGSENKSKFAMLNPSDSLVDWVLKTVPTMGAGWCPPGMLGIGVGGTAEKAMLLAKQSLMEDIDMYELLARGPQSKLEELRIELFEKVNALGIGAQGLGGLTTVLDVKISTFATHAASLPVAMIPNCAATRHAHFTLDGSGPAKLEAPSLSEWPDVHWQPDYNKSQQVDLNTLTREQVAGWKPGQTLLLSGKMLTGRDAAHKRIQDMLAKGEPLPVSFANRVIYYVGPVDPVRDEVVGPAGPPPAPPQDKLTEQDAGRDRPDRDDRKIRTRAGGHRGHQEAWFGLSDGGGRRGLSGVQGHTRGARGGLRRPRHGSHLRVRRERHAGDGGGGCARYFRAHHRPQGMAGQDRQDPGHRAVEPRGGVPIHRDACRPGALRPAPSRPPGWRWRRRPCPARRAALPPCAGPA